MSCIGMSTCEFIRYSSQNEGHQGKSDIAPTMHQAFGRHLLSDLLVILFIVRDHVVNMHTATAFMVIEPRGDIVNCFQSELQ